MKKRIDQIFNFIREGRDDCEDTEERILFFVYTFVVGASVVVIAITILLLCFMFPFIMIPLIIGISLGWKGYKQL